MHIDTHAQPRTLGGRQLIGSSSRNYIRHNYIGHNCKGHNYVGWQAANRKRRQKTLLTHKIIDFAATKDQACTYDYIGHNYMGP